jgi:hypothetical protein
LVFSLRRCPQFGKNRTYSGRAYSLECSQKIGRWKGISSLSLRRKFSRIR